MEKAIGILINVFFLYFLPFFLIFRKLAHCELSKVKGPSLKISHLGSCCHVQLVSGRQYSVYVVKVWVSKITFTDRVYSPKIS